jgi:asparagine synthase (glutamine-hydrolysing)
MLTPKTAGLVEYGGSYAGAWFLHRGLFMRWELSSVLQPDVVREGLARQDPQAAVSETLVPIPAGGFARVASMEASLYTRNQKLRDASWHTVPVRLVA